MNDKAMQNVERTPERALVQDKDTLRGLLDVASSSIADIVPKHLTVERVLKMALIAASRQSRLYECTRNSLLQAVMRAAELGLDFSGTLGMGYLVPYFNKDLQAYEVQFIAGYRGLMELAHRSGRIDSIQARVVYDADSFELEYGTAQRLVHLPSLSEGPRSFRCVYAIADLKGDGAKVQQIEVMTKAQVDAIRKGSPAGRAGPWATHYDEMARKTVVRRLCKYLPLSPELEKALAAEDDIEQRYTTPTPLAIDRPQDGSAGERVARTVRSAQAASAPAPTSKDSLQVAPATPPPVVKESLKTDDEPPALEFDRDEYIQRLGDVVGELTDAAASKLRTRFNMPSLTDGDSLRKLNDDDLRSLTMSAETRTRKGK